MASARLVQPLGLRRLGWRGPRNVTTPRGSATSAWPPHRVAPNWSQLHATAVPTISGACGSTNSWRQGASSTRSWPFYIESSAWKLSHVSDNRHRALLTPKIGTGKGLSCGLSLVMKYRSAGKDLLRGFVKNACGRQCTIIRQKDCLRF
jgi:hypothetical protein